MARPTLTLLMRGYRKNWLRLGVGIAALVIGQIATIFIPKFTGLAIDSVLPTPQTPRSDVFSHMAQTIGGFASSSSETRFGACVLALIVIALVAGLFQFIKRFFIIGMSRRLEFELKQGLFEHLQKLSLSFFTRMRSGDVVSRATSDVEAVRMMSGPALMYILEAATMLVLALLAMASLSLPLMAWALLPLGLLTAATAIFSPLQRKRSLELQRRQADLAARAQENFSGIRVVKAFGREQFEAEAMERLGQAEFEAQMQVARASISMQSVLNVAGGLAMLVFLFFGASEVAAGSLSLGAFLEFNLYFLLLFWPMIALGWASMLLVRGLVSSRRIDELLGAGVDPSFTIGTEHPPIRGKIEVRDLSFGWTPDKPVLRSVSFTVHPGKSLAIVGTVGSGKSTMASLLLRLAQPGHGQILIDDHPIESIDAQHLRRNIGYVPQESFLFSESIADNIAFGGDGFSREDVMRAACGAQLAPEIEGFPHGYDTLLGERGINLSGGQRQRTAIARALIKRPPIVILDDCLSAVDTRTEEALLATFRGELRGSTCIIISQRTSTVAWADEILVLDGGSIVERGTIEELRRRNGHFARLDRRQREQSTHTTK